MFRRPIGESLSVVAVTQSGFMPSSRSRIVWRWLSFPPLTGNDAVIARAVLGAIPVEDLDQLGPARRPVDLTAQLEGAAGVADALLVDEEVRLRLGHDAARAVADVPRRCLGRHILSHVITSSASMSTRASRPTITSMCFGMTP